MIKNAGKLFLPKLKLMLLEKEISSFLTGRNAWEEGMADEDPEVEEGTEEDPAKEEEEEEEEEEELE